VIKQLTKSQCGGRSAFTGDAKIRALHQFFLEKITLSWQMPDQRQQSSNQGTEEKMGAQRKS
jgi:hypothetical protein